MRACPAPHVSPNCSQPACAPPACATSRPPRINPPYLTAVTANSNSHARGTLALLSTLPIGQLFGHAGASSLDAALGSPSTPGAGALGDEAGAAVGGGNGAASPGGRAEGADGTASGPQSRRNSHSFKVSAAGGRGRLSGAGTQEVYFMGLVDIMSEYGLAKQLELSKLAPDVPAAPHFPGAGENAAAGYAGQSRALGRWPSHGVVDPISYSKRFQAFLSEHID